MPRPRRAVLLTGNVLCNNPRVIKEADALSEAGWDVEVLGAWISDEFVERDRALAEKRPWRFTPVVTPSTSVWPRLRSKLSRGAGAILGTQHGWQLGYCGPELLSAARSMTGDLFVAHSEQALWVARELARRGHRVGVDFEDWYSRDAAADTHAGRPLALMESLERELVTLAVSRTCPSQAMSHALAACFHTPPPTVVYNAFPWSDRLSYDGERRDRTSVNRPSIYWYSQTVGPGRGLEVLCAALTDVDADAELHIRGAVSSFYKDTLIAALPNVWRHRVFFHEPVSNDELPSRIAEHDIGYSGEDVQSESRDLTITNKLLHGLVSGLAMVASDTAGTREVAAIAPGAVVSFEPRNPAQLAAALNSLLSSPTRLDDARQSALAAARQVLSWEHQIPTLLAAFEAALERPVTR